MASTQKPQRRLWTRLHFLIRFLGLTGFLVAGVGLGLALVINPPTSLEAVRNFLEKNLPFWKLDPTVDPIQRWSGGLLLGGGLALVLALLIEAIAMLRLVAGRRSAFGTFALVQVGLAIALLVGLNYYSYRHYLRFDWTRQHQFTLDKDIQDQLRELHGTTTIVVYQRHKTFGSLSDKPDRYDYAAERKVVEKVKDLVEQFREFGPQFRVVVLDVEQEDFDSQLKALTERYQLTDQSLAALRVSGVPEAFLEKLKTLKLREFKSRDQFLGELAKLDKNELKRFQEAILNQALTSEARELGQAIDRAPENSIFFCSGDRVQRLSFNDFYRLDKTASQGGEGEPSNLVLRFQKVGPFARKVLNIDEKKPRVAIAVTHELLTSDGAAEEYTLAGVKKVLRERGFDSRDLILKKWTRRAPPEPAVYTYEESKYERLADRIEVLNTQLAFFEKQLAAWKGMTAKELEKRKMDEEEQRIQVQNWGSLVEQAKKQKDLAVKDRPRLEMESLAEQRRLTDIRAKMDKALADCDLLILPRMTLRNVTLPPFNVPNEVHRLDTAQVASIKEFLKRGKPVLACFGPVNESPDERPFPGSGGPDGLEEMFDQLGLKLAKQTVLYDREIGSLAEFQAALQGRREMDLMSRGDDSDVPPLRLERVATVKSGEADKKTNPIGESLRQTERAVGKEQGLNLRVRHPRPVTFEPAAGKTLASAPEFLWTDPDSWREDQPFPTEKNLPRYEESKKRGPVPVAAAVKVKLPADWFGKEEARPDPDEVRLVAIGNGNLFVGTTLPPAKEKLLLDTCNWLLGREDQLAKEGEEWSFPRVALSSRDQTLWAWGTMLGLPVLFAYLGLVVLLVRRLR